MDMRAEADSGITRLLDQWKSGDSSVENALAERIYPILRAQAQAQVKRNGPALTLCATELAHEAYERLVGQREVDWQNREHFFAIAATVLRRVAVDYVRQRHAEKRGGDVVLLPLDTASVEELAEVAPAIDWLEMDQALDELGKVDPALVRLVEMRVFAGLGLEQIAEVTGASLATIGRRWRFARAWLAERLTRTT
jgi:RNA polymerase sigma factor (TIGR02999 family)